METEQVAGANAYTARGNLSVYRFGKGNNSHAKKRAILMEQSKRQCLQIKLLLVNTIVMIATLVLIVVCSVALFKLEGMTPEKRLTLEHVIDEQSDYLIERIGLICR